jgi:hypothetical protein
MSLNKKVLLKSTSYAVACICLSLSVDVADASCKNRNYNCTTTKKVEKVEPSEIQSTDVKNKAVAARSKSNERVIYQNSPSRPGYVKLHYEFVGFDGSPLTYSDQDLKKSHMDRSIKDWLISLFQKTDRIYIVSLDLKQGDKTIAHQPIYTVRNNGSFFDIISQEDLKLSGAVGYWMRSTEPVTAQVNVHYTDSNEYSPEQLAAIVKKGLAVGAKFATVSSLVNQATLAAYDTVISDISSELKFKFKRSDDMSRSHQLKSEEGGRVGYHFDFFAPGEGDISERFVLKLELKHRESLLNKDGETAALDILSRRLHKEGDSTTDVATFIETHDISKAAVDTLTQAEPDVWNICKRIKEALRERLVARDISIALNAFVSARDNDFNKAWNPNCFSGDDLKHIASADIVPALGTLGAGKKVQLTFNEQKNLARKYYSRFMEEQTSSEARDLLKELFVEKFGNQYNYYIDAQVPILDGEIFSGEGKLNFLAAILKGLKLKRKLSCFSGDMYDSKNPDGPKNIFGSLSENDGQVLEILLGFEEAPFDRKKVVAQRITIKPATQDVLVRYRDAHKDRAKKGCDGGWKPWEVKVAESG